MKFVLAMFLIVASTAPAASAATATASTQPSPQEAHAQAYVLMSAGKLGEATPLLNRAYNETPPAQRSRALVINRAILDLAQKQNLLRGIRDLSEHLARNPEPDEEASNVLGAALDRAADNPKSRADPVYAAALREFARREAALERRRPGLRRWGAAWVTDEEFAPLRQNEQAYLERLEAARAELQQFANDSQSRDQEYRDAHRYLREFMTTHGHAKMNGGILLPDCPKCQEALSAHQTIDRVRTETRADNGDLQRLTRAYETLKRQPVKPDWPTRFDPIDPSAAAPDPLPPPPSRGLSAAAAAPARVTTTQPTEVMP